MPPHEFICRNSFVCILLLWKFCFFILLFKHLDGPKRLKSKEWNKWNITQETKKKTDDFKSASTVLLFKHFEIEIKKLKCWMNCICQHEVQNEVLSILFFKCSCFINFNCGKIMISIHPTQIHNYELIWKGLKAFEQ